MQVDIAHLFCSILLSLGVALVELVLVNVNANAKPPPLFYFVHFSLYEAA
jgi:hypothetical protein